MTQCSRNRINNATYITNRYITKEGYLKLEVKVPCGILGIYLKKEDYKKIGINPESYGAMNYEIPVYGKENILRAMKRNIQELSYRNSYNRAGLNNYEHPFNELYSVATLSRSLTISQIRFLKTLADLENQELLDEKISREQPIAIRKIA